MNMELKYKVEKEEVVKQILKNKLHLSKRFIKKLKESNRITKNENKVQINAIAKVGDVIGVNIDFDEECNNIVATDIPIDIIYEDEAYIVLNKQPKIETHPTCANYSNTLANGLKFYFEKKSIKKKIRPVNRLDKETSGLIVFAKNEYVQEQLVQQMKKDIFKKEYIAIVEGTIDKRFGVIEAPIKRKKGSVIERCIAEDGDIAITEYEIFKRLGNKTVVKCRLRTGRTHQIRVHMKYIGHPIISDFLYGTKSSFIDRHALHSYKLEFEHPIKRKIMTYEIELPEDMKKVISSLDER